MRCNEKNREQNDLRRKVENWSKKCFERRKTIANHILCCSTITSFGSLHDVYSTNESISFQLMTPCLKLNFSMVQLLVDDIPSLSSFFYAMLLTARRSREQFHNSIGTPVVLVALTSNSRSIQSPNSFLLLLRKQKHRLLLLASIRQSFFKQRQRMLFMIFNTVIMMASWPPYIK